ncbi:hypothetical protein ACO0R3_003830 [Hanseniaspora guilliermondii]
MLHQNQSKHSTILIKPKPNSKEDYFHCQDNVSCNNFQNKHIEFSNCKNHVSKAFLKKHIPKSPMPKHMSSASYNNLTDLNFESEEEDDDGDLDDFDDDSNIDTLNIPEEEENMLRTESTKSLAKVNPLYNMSNYPHNPPKSEDFKIGTVVKDNSDVKHAHLPRTPFPKGFSNNETSETLESLEKQNIHLDLEKSSMLNRRRTSSTHQSPNKIELKSKNKNIEEL